MSLTQLFKNNYKALLNSCDNWLLWHKDQSFLILLSWCVGLLGFRHWVLELEIHEVDYCFSDRLSWSVHVPERRSNPKYPMPSIEGPQQLSSPLLILVTESFYDLYFLKRAGGDRL